MEFTTGFNGTNKEGLDYEVVDGSRKHHIKIQFKLDGSEVTTTNIYLKRGLPLHPTFNKFFAGKKCKGKLC